jgi:hypothetical protein
MSENESGAVDPRTVHPRAAVDIVHNFWAEVWQRPHNADAIDDLVTEDFVITSGGTEADGRPVHMTGTAVWAVREDGLLSHNWVERNALEVYLRLQTT